MRARYEIVDRYKGLRVCIPGEVIDLLPDTPQAKLRKLHAMGYEGVILVSDSPDEGKDPED